MLDLGIIEFTRKNGSEEIIGSCNGHSLLNFWQWAYSDLVGNTERGVLAEFIVAMACGIEHKPRISWDVYDLESLEGIKIEVKSSAYIQTWKQKTYSKPIFNIPITRAWDYKENILHMDKKRHSDVYVFAMLAHKDQPTLNPLNLNQWEFYVLATKQLSELYSNQKTISLSSIQKHTSCVHYNNLKEEILKRYNEIVDKTEVF